MHGLKTSFRRTMKNLKTRLLFAGKLLVALLAIAVLLLIAGRDLFTLISPVKLLLYSGLGALLLIGVVSVQAAALWTMSPAECAQGKSTAAGK
ncbi:hypothetical protein AB4Z46_18090 [Variovorax sp. M-6]|uniref:hypothetical protein n=1 Tax=Variovorax sp. M-6 TaxID=3233041 RepID=UPI003F99E068